MSDWGVELGRMIRRTEQRVASLKQSVSVAGRAGDRDLVALLKDARKDEERFLKSLRHEKTCWNAGVWEWGLT